MELRKIPVELERALKLKSKLLPASLAYLEILETEMSERVADARRADSELEQWVFYLTELSDSGAIRKQAQLQAERITALRERMFMLEDEQIDARSAYEKAFKRKKRGSSNGRHSGASNTSRYMNETPLTSSLSAANLLPAFMQPSRTSPAPHVEKVDDIMSTALSTLIRAQNRFRATERRLKRTLAMAARMAHVLAPEIIAFVPNIIDPSTRRLRLLGLDHGGKNTSTVGGQDSECTDNTEASVPWLNLGNYSNIEIFRTLRYSYSSGNLTFSSHGLPRQDIQKKDNSNCNMATQKNEEWIFSAERDGQRVLLKGYGIQHRPSSILSRFSSPSLSSMSHVPRNPERVRSDGISSDLGSSGGPLRSLNDHVLADNSDVDCTTNEFTLGKFGVEISGEKIEEQNANNIKVIPDRVVGIDSDIVYDAEVRSTDLTSSSNSAAVLENEDELEWLLTMPRMHESIAGVTALVDAYGGLCDPHAILSEVINSNGGFGDPPLRDNPTSDDDDTFSATCADNYVVLSPQTMPLFYVELPFPVPGTSLKDWILGTLPSSRWTPPSLSARRGSAMP